MLALNWPWWFVVLIVAVEAWPVALGLGLSFLALAVFARRWLRWVSLLIALPCLAATLVAAWWGIDRWRQDRETAVFEAKIHQVLERDQVIEGLALPAGTALQWRDVDHRQLRMASPPDPVVLFGLHVSWIQRTDDGEGWDLMLPGPELVEGWRCAGLGVQVSRTGQLRSCRLAAGRRWRGWPIPDGSLLDLTTADKVGLALPDGASMAALEIGHAITATGAFSFNADGSLDRFSFPDDDPLVVAGRRLGNTVQWSYDPATLGQGRRRRPVTVRGTLAAADGSGGEDVIIRLSDGRVTPAE